MKTKSKILSLFLALTLIVGLIPMNGIGAFATGGTLGGSGTADDPYQINDAEDLKAFRDKVNGGSTSACGKLMADIDLNPGIIFNADGTCTGGTPTQWASIGNTITNYTGTFDGNGHKVSGVYINDENANFQGLFGWTDTGVVIKNLGVENSYIRGGRHVGGVVGNNNNGTVENCYNTGAVSGKDQRVGGVVGYNINGTVENCYNTGVVSGTNDVGGVAGGSLDGTVMNCYNTGTVSGTSSFVGGVIGNNYASKVTNCYNTGAVSGTGFSVGGVAGYCVGSNVTVTNCYNTGTVSGTGDYVGGVVGDNQGTVVNCYNTGAVSGTSSVGGVVGENYTGKLTNCYYLNTTAQMGIGISGGGGKGTAKALTVTQMTGTAAKTNMTGFDFNTVWVAGKSHWQYEKTIDETSDLYKYTGEYPKLKIFDAFVKGEAEGTVTFSEIANQTYTGEAITPDITVKFGETTLVKGTDYEVAYADNTNVGTATATVTLGGNSSNTKTVNFEITAKAMEADDITVDPIADQTYTGEEITPNVTVKDGEKVLVKGTDYEVAYENNTNVGTATAKITLKGNYTGEKTVNFEITAKAMEADDITVDEIADQTYTGEEITPDVIVKDGETVLVKGTDYEVTYDNNINVGTATAKITLKGNYSGEKTVEFKIVAKAMGADDITVDPIADQTYTGEEITPNVTVKDGEKVLVKGTDYEVAYENNTNVGTATAKITLKGNYSGEKTVEFKIVAKAMGADDITVDPIADQTYTGEEITPNVTVKDGEKVLAKGKDYEVTYENNTNVGTATAKITLKGNYSGTKTVEFKIVAKAMGADDITVDPIADQTYTGEEITPNVTVKDGEKVLVKGTDYEVAYDNNINVGTATAKITLKGNYSGEKTVEFKIVAKAMGADDITVDPIADQTYTGEEITPNVTVKDGEKVLAKGKDYEVTYENNTNVGTATAKITLKGNYSGEKTVEFKITAKAIAADDITVDPIASQTYTGKAITPDVTVKVGETVLAKGKDYEVAYENNTNVGTATATVKLKGNYAGEKTVNFEITAKAMEADDITVDPIASQTYTGKAITPEVTVKDGETVLVKGTDYEVSYVDNINVGTATATVTLKGNYAGTKTVNFEITAKEIAADDITVDEIAAQTYTGNEITPDVTVKNGETILVKGTDYEVSYENNTNVGTATAKITLKGNYAGETSVTFSIIKSDNPSDNPSDEPSDKPSDEPSDEPSGEPSDEPSNGNNSNSSQTGSDGNPVKTGDNGMTALLVLVAFASGVSALVVIKRKRSTEE